MLSSYVVAFAGFLEFFRLGRFRNNKIFFITVMLGWWGFIPLMSRLLTGFASGDQLRGSLVSPFAGVAYAVALITEAKQPELLAVMIPCVIAGLMWLLAHQEHAAVEKQSQGH